MNDRPLFALGRVSITLTAAAALKSAGQTVVEFLARHCAGDWGQVEEEDAHDNNDSIVMGAQLLSEYILNTGVEIWIVTEADRSATTICLHHEY